jgi:hypothetical protein
MAILILSAVRTSNPACPDEKLICPIQFKFLLKFLELPNKIL